MHQSTVSSVNTYFGDRIGFTVRTLPASPFFSLSRARTHPNPSAIYPKKETQTRVFGKQRHKHKERNGSNVQWEKKKTAASAAAGRQLQCLSTLLTYKSQNIFTFICVEHKRWHFCIWIYLWGIAKATIHRVALLNDTTNWKREKTAYKIPELI